MIGTTCPNCGAALVFRTAVSVFAVCSYCGSTMLRTDRDVSLIGTMADLPDEMTPLQVGTTLTYHGATWTLAGRVRVGWTDGAWNEWYMASGDSVGWLAEAQGFLSAAFEARLETAEGIVPGRLPVLDDMITVDGRTYIVTDIKEATVIGSEGELPFRAPQGRRSTYFDMLGDGSGFAGFEASDAERLLYVGEYVEFDSLGFRNLRPVEGWAAPA